MRRRWQAAGPPVGRPRPRHPASPLPCRRRAYNISELKAGSKAPNVGVGVQTSLGKALSEDYKVSFDTKGRQTVATGGWPANNAPILTSHQACDGWLHVVTGVLRPKQQYT